MSLDQLEQLTRSLRELVEAATPHPPAVEVVRSESRVSWAHFPKLDLSDSEELDSWFLSFETRMRAGRILEEAWLEKFLECPEVDESIKARIRSFEVASYADLRRLLLKEHGPIDPRNYYRRAMYRLKGSTREEVREGLVKLFIKHNRACRDEGREEMAMQDLCYPFVEAFPLPTRKHLEKQLALVFPLQDPFEHLCRQAPTKMDVDLKTIQEAERAGEDEEALSGKRARSVAFEEGDLRDAVALVLQDFGLTRPQAAKRFKAKASGNQQRFQGRPPKACTGCGGSCKDRSACPARQIVCFACQKVGHLAKVCFTKAQGSFQGKPKNPFRERPTSA